MLAGGWGDEGGDARDGGVGKAGHVPFLARPPPPWGRVRGSPFVHNVLNNFTY